MKKRTLTFFIIMCMAVCSASGVATLLGYEAENRENRPLARLPALMDDGAINLAFPSEFDRYFEDHFGLREEMVTAFHGLTMATLGDTLNEKVVVGDGMLFFEETLDDYLGVNRMSDGDIARAATALRLQSEYAASLGASFTFAVAPNKNSIYPELMPRRLRGTRLPSNRERLYAALSGNVATLDFAALLTARKGEGLLYHPRDTHWNERGALIAFDAIMARVAPESRASAGYAALTPAMQYDYAGDLHNFVLPAVEGANARPVYPIDASYTLDPRARPAQDAAFGTRSAAAAEGNPSGDNAAASDATADLYLMRDSFADALIPYLSANLGRVVYSREFPYNYLPAAKETPRAVMIELVERNIPNLLLSAPLMPALETTLPDAAVEVEAVILTKERSGFKQVYGYFDGGNFPANSRIFLQADDVCYEAFPIMEADAREAAAPYARPYGFSLTLPTASSAARVWVR